MKKILVLGTGAPQLDLIKECKARGLDVFACSYRSGDIAEQFVDFFAPINITNVDDVKKYAKENNIDYIYSVGSDIAMPTAFKVSEDLALPHFCSSKTANICNHKALLRDVLGNEYGWNLVHQRVTTLDDSLSMDFPFIMKPTDSQGQRGVFLIHNRKEYEELFAQSLSFSREKAIILEEYVYGDEISINTFSSNGKIVFFLVSDRIAWKEFPGGIIHRHIIPSKYENNDKVIFQLRDLARTTLEKLKISNGPAYFQVIISPGGKPNLIEVSPRLDGCHMWRLIKYATGVDLLALTIDGLIGGFPKKYIDYDVVPFEIEFLCQSSEEVLKKEFFHIIKPYKYLQWYYREGDKPRKMNGYMEKCG